MLRSRFLLPVTLTVLAVSASASSTALASFEKTGVKCEAGIPTLCLAATEGGALFEAKGSETYTGKLVVGTEALLAVASLGLVIACNKDASTGEIEQSEPLIHAVIAKKGFLTFSECAVRGAHEKECKVVEPIKTKALKGAVIDEMPISAGTVEPETGTIITELEIGNQTGQLCPATIKGVNPVKGSDLCIGIEAEADKAVHTGECKAEGSKLEFGTNKATFECKTEGELTSKLLSDVSLA